MKNLVLLVVLAGILVCGRSRAEVPLILHSRSSIAAGDTYTCVILDDQSVKCWGYGGDGRLGTNQTFSQTVSLSQPVQLGKNKAGKAYKALSLSSTGGRTCAILDDGMIKCWGNNNYGQAGYSQLTATYYNNYNILDPSAQDPVDLSYDREKGPYKVSFVVAGARNTCAVIEDGNIECFGEVHRIDNSIIEAKKKFEKSQDAVLKLEEEIKVFKEEEAKDPEKRKRDADAQYLQELAKAQKNAAAELKRFDKKIKDKKQREYAKEDYQQREKIYEDELKKKQESAIGKFEADLKIKTNSLARLKNQEQTDLLTYTSAKKGLSNSIIDLGKDADGRSYKAIQVAIGISYFCAILDDGQVKCWGNGSNGSLGEMPGQLKASDAKPLFLGMKPDGTPYRARAIYARDYVTCVILDDFSGKCWGYDSGNGRFGNGNFAEKNLIPSMIPSFDLGTDSIGNSLKIDSLSLGAQFICALFQGGGVKCWGTNNRGELGLGDRNRRYGYDKATMGNNLPFVDLGFEADALSCGDSHCCATYRVNHIVKCWGGNNNFNLGLGDTEDRGYKKDQMGDDLPFVDLGLLRSVYAPEKINVGRK